MLPLSTEASLGLAHLIEFGIVLLVNVVLEDLILLVLGMLILQPFNYLLLLGTALTILQVIHIKLVLEIVDIGVLLHICAIETLQLSLKALIFLLEFGLHIFDTLEALVSTFELDSSSLDGVLEDSFVATQGFDGLLHLVHLAGLSINDVANTLLNVLLFTVLVQITTDRIQKFQGLVSGGPHFSLSAKHVVQFGSTFGDFSGQLSCRLQVVQLGASVEIHHLRVRLVIVIHFGRLHGLVHHRGDFQHLLNGVTLSLIKTLRIQSYSRLLLEQGAYLFDKLDTIFALIDIV